MFDVQMKTEAWRFSQAAPGGVKFIRFSGTQMSCSYMVYIEFEKFCVSLASVIETSYIKASKWTVIIKNGSSSVMLGKHD